MGKVATSFRREARITSRSNLPGITDDILCPHIETQVATTQEQEKEPLGREKTILPRKAKK